MWLSKVLLWSKKCQFHLHISLHQFLSILVTFLMRMFACLWVSTWMFLVHFWFWFQMCTYGGHAFKSKSCLRLEIQNHNRLFESNVCCTTFIKRIKVIRLQQYQNQICFLSIRHFQWWHHYWTSTHPSFNWPFWMLQP
jgi:hypothetical protein